MTVAVLYVNRALQGGAIAGLRLAHLRGEADWTAPRSEKASEDPLAVIAAAAEWAATTLKQTPGPATLTVVIDPQGTNCHWLSAPTADPAVVRATVRDALSAGDDEEGGLPLSWLSETNPGTDSSVQGLGDVAVLEKKVTAPRQRMALLSVNDLPVRVLLDELDKRDVVVGRVCTLWHAMALAWDPATRSGPADDGRVVSGGDPVGATVVVEPTGELVWCWSQGGTMIAGGTLLLRRGVAEGSVPQASAGLRLAGDDSAVAVVDEDEVVEAVKADVGRVTSDWLGWSVQLGVAPSRVTVIGPKDLTCNGEGMGVAGMEGLGALGAAIGKHWPGASVQATADQDAVGKTLKRLVDIENTVNPSGTPVAAVDPRLSLTELSGRPGAADRRLHRWAGLALLVGAAAVGLIGWRVGQTVDGIRAESVRLGVEQQETLKKVEWAAPAALKSETPELVLRGKRIEMDKVRADQKDEEPILAEAERVLLVLATVPDVRLKNLQLYGWAVTSRVELSVPIDGDQGPTVKELLDQRPSQSNRVVKWDGRHVRTGDTERRNYNMAGQFVEAPKRAVKPATPQVPAAGPTQDASTPAAPQPEGAAAPAATPPGTQPFDVPPPPATEPVPGEPQPEPKEEPK